MIRSEDLRRAEQEISRRSLRRLRVQGDLSLAEAGTLLEVDKSHVMRMERGERNPPLLGKLASAFSIRELDARASCEACLYLPPDGFTCQSCGCAEPFPVAELRRRVRASFIVPPGDSSRYRVLDIPLGLDEISECKTVEYLLGRALSAGAGWSLTGYKHCN